MSETKTFWITKYALTRGVFSVQARISKADTCDYAVGEEGLFCRIGRDAFESETEAIQDALDRARAKIVALQTQSKRLHTKIQEFERQCAEAEKSKR